MHAGNLPDTFRPAPPGARPPQLDDLVAALGAAGREQFRQAMAQILASCRDGGR